MEKEPYVGKYYDFENKIVVDVSGKSIDALLASFVQMLELAKSVDVSAVRTVTVSNQDEEGAHLITTYDYLDDDEYERKPINVLKPTLSVTNDLCMLEVGFENSNLLSDFKEIIETVSKELSQFGTAQYLDVSYSSVAGDDPDPVGFFRVYFRK